jgi:hypothetical protein
MEHYMKKSYLFLASLAALASTPSFAQGSGSGGISVVLSTLATRVQLVELRPQLTPIQMDPACEERNRRVDGSFENCALPQYPTGLAELTFKYENPSSFETGEELYASVAMTYASLGLQQGSRVTSARRLNQMFSVTVSAATSAVNSSYYPPGHPCFSMELPELYCTVPAEPYSFGQNVSRVTIRRR